MRDQVNTDVLRMSGSSVVQIPKFSNPGLAQVGTDVPRIDALV